MIIANPLYDVVFKYLLEDGDIARELLAIILEEEIVTLEVKPQETSSESTGGINILRFDFHAVVRKQNGELQKVLIELQKAKQAFDVMRFRRYLGDNYRREDLVVNERGESDTRPLPIVTIYFLGFTLENIRSGVVKINREYRDVVTREILDIKEEFVELLTHDSYLIQVRRLPRQARSRVERALQVFSPLFQTTENRHHLDFQGDTSDMLVKKMVDRLGRAIASEEIRDRMEVEDEIDRAFVREMKKLAAEKDEIIAEKEELLAEKDEMIEEERKRADEEKRRADEAQQLAEEARLRYEELLRQLEELKKKPKS